MMPARPKQNDKLEIVTTPINVTHWISDKLLPNCLWIVGKATLMLPKLLKNKNAARQVTMRIARSSVLVRLVAGSAVCVCGSMKEQLGAIFLSLTRVTSPA